MPCSSAKNTAEKLKRLGQLSRTEKRRISILISMKRKISICALTFCRLIVVV